MNIVTIDFDIIMAPSINLYNDYVGEDTVDDLIEEYPFLKYMPIDYGIYEYLTRYIISVCRKINNIYFVSDHGSVAKILRKMDINENEFVTLYNIDHHHDVSYDEDRYEKMDLYANCGNWVKYCADRQLINKYIWIQDENSENDLPDDIDDKYIQEIWDIRKFPLRKLYDTTDALIICASDEWVPSEYKILYLIWLAICEEMTTKEIEIDGFKRD